MKTQQIRVTIAGREHLVGADDVVAALEHVLPEPVKDHFAVVAGRRFPVKQVIAAVTGSDRADFASHHARRILRRLGFPVGRRMSTTDQKAPDPDLESWPHGGREAEVLDPYAGRWVAQRGLEVLVSADTPQEVVAWLQRHDLRADSVFRVPRHASETEVSPEVPIQGASRHG